MNLTEHGGELTMTEQKAQSSAGSTKPSASRIDPVALATLVCVVMMMATSFWNLWNLNRRISAIEAVVGARPAGPDPDRIYAVNTEGAPTKGPENALVTIVEFSDFECPFCAKVVPTLKRIEETYKDRVRIVWKHLPLSIHEDARDAALAAEVAGKQGKFWEFHDRLFANQDKLKPEDLKAHAKDLELDMARFEADMQKAEEKKRIDADVAEAATLGVSGTPGFFVNGRFVFGAQPYETFATLIDEEIEKAEAKRPSSSE
jgi:protein-disulfide isomerase